MSETSPPADPPSRYQLFESALGSAEWTLEELWLEYVALGGVLVVFDLDAFLAGVMPMPPEQQDVLACALNERLADLDQPARVPYLSTLPEPLTEILDALMSQLSGAAPSPTVPVRPGAGEDVMAAMVTVQGEVDGTLRIVGAVLPSFPPNAPAKPAYYDIMLNLSRRFTASELAVARDLSPLQQQVARQPPFPTSRIRLPCDVAEGASLVLSNTNVDELRDTAPHLVELVELIENTGRALASEANEYRLAIEAQLPHIHFDI